MKKLIFFAVVALWLLPNGMWAQNGQDKGYQAITIEAIQGQLEFLASDWTDGRETGTKGEYMAADYIASIFKLYGLAPGGDLEQVRMTRGTRAPGGGQSFQRPEPRKTYFQNFDLVATSPGAEQELSVVTKTSAGSSAIEFNFQTDFSLTPGQAGIEAEVPVVFIGYGLVDEKNGYDDFKGLDLNGKIVVKLTGFPGHLDPSSKTYEKFKPAVLQEDDRAAMMQRFRGSRNRYPWASEKGVLGIIEIRPGSNPTAQWASNVPFRYNTARYEGDVAQPRSNTRMAIMGSSIASDPMTLTVTDRIVSALFEGTGYDIASLEKQIQESGKSASRAIAGKYLHIKTTVDSKIVRCRNVIGYLEGENPEDVIVIGAHYDHLGNQNGFIYNGADDNASGTVGVMTIAKAMIASGVKPKQSIVFCAWTGEEKGLLGSNYFVSNHYDYNIVANLNYDMISRNSQGEDQDNKISVTFSNSKPIFKELVEKYNIEKDMGLEINFRGSDRPGGGSDHAPFATKEIPIYYFMAGMPEEYHQFNDHVELVNWPKMLKIIQLGYLSIYDLANMNW